MSENENDSEGTEPFGDELSATELYALWYCLAFLEPAKYKMLFLVTERKVALSAADKKRELQKGLASLHEKGHIALAKNGLGEYEPAQVLIKGIRVNTSGLIMRDRQ
ncbi:MAG: hypothetical protein Q7R39_01295 [Dehalococcoidia bacterium]|nr:hypothetical protein [Dehalococcoidia bacterium]